MSIESVMPSNHLILCRPLLLLCSIFPSIRVFSNESALSTSWPKYWSFSFSISPSNEYSGLISFRMDWFYLLAVQGTLWGICLSHLQGSELTESEYIGARPRNLYFLANAHSGRSEAPRPLCRMLGWMVRADIRAGFWV